MRLPQRFVIAAWTVALAMGSCQAQSRPGGASRQARRGAGTYKSVRIDGVPHVRQKPDFCGEACLAMWLAKLGHAGWDQDAVFDQSGLDPLLARGCHTPELARAARKIGFKVGRVAFQVPAARAPAAMEARWKALHADLLRGVPSIVCMRYNRKPKAPEHFRLILGYDAKTDSVIYHEPAEDRGAWRSMARADLLDLWPLKYSRSRWTVIHLRLEPGTIRPATPAKTFTTADYAQHIMRLKKKIPKGGGFTVVIEPPFVVIGDEKPAVVRRRAVQTVRWSVQRLKKAYFRKDPVAILDIWLFKNRASYRKHTQEIFRQKPTTPFGYYSHRAKALIMNIATGGGTLVHEIVHPFMEGNFPACPAWFNEGLGSLYEQCGNKRGRIHGYTNWRLAGLQKAIRAGRVPSFRTLTATTGDEFYQQDPGTNYSQSRYLCYYLQQHGLLRKFYHAFRANHKKDPTGLETLKKTLGVRDLAAFKKQWEAYVLKLRFR